MKSLICVSFLLLITYASASLDWEHFKAFYGKSYKSSEEQSRKKLYEDNLKTIEEHNRNFTKGQTSYTMRINKFSDMMPDEFKTKRTSLNKLETSADIILSEKSKMYESSNDDLPDSVDWRQKGAVTAVKNQFVDRCRSSWAFSATGSVEGQHFLKKRKLVSLSAQNLVDCAREYDTYGCNGGSVKGAFQYIKHNEGIDTEESYPYKGLDNPCRYNSSNIGATIEGHVSIKGGDEQALKHAVALVGPISAGMEVTTKFHSYGGGIFYDPDCTSNFPNHYVLIIGYGSENGQDYWIIKNSYGKSWGEEGYMRIPRNKNMCGIASHAMYPIVPS